MRVAEQLTYFLGIALAITYGLQLWLWSFILVGVILVVILIGAIVEGIRLFNWVFIIAFIAQIVLIIMEVFSVVALVIYCVFLLIAIMASIMYGECNFNSVKLTGPFQVAHMDAHCKKDGTALSIWYPMDKEVYNVQIKEKNKNSFWLRYGYTSRLGMTKATSSWGTEDHGHPWIFKYIDDIKMDTVEHGTLAKVFRESEGDEPVKKLVPMIYCHGLACNRTMQSVTCRDFASHGFLVISLDHFDGSANYSRKENGEEKFWSSIDTAVEDKERARQWLEIRKKEVTALIDDMFEDKYAQNTVNLPETVQLDLDKLSIGGHSFGAMTGIAVANMDDRVKASFGLDPWLWTIVEEIDESKFTVNKPNCYIISEAFPPEVIHFFDYDTVKSLKYMQDQSSSNEKELVIVKQTGHYHQCDAVVLIPLESFMRTGTRLQLNYTDLYLLHSQLCIDFLHRTGFANACDRKDVVDNIGKLKEQYVRYLRKYDTDTNTSPWIGLIEEGDEKEEITEEKGDKEPLLSNKNEKN